MKTIIAYAAFCLALLCSNSVNALTIKGKVIDGNNATPLEFANVAIMQMQSKSLLAGGVTDSKGNFKFVINTSGNISIRITSVGFKEYKMPIRQTGDSINLGSIELEADNKTLKEVSVLGQGSQMKFNVDKKVFSVDQSIATAGGSASEVLGSIPSINVDDQGNVALRNNSSVEVWINGKPSGLTSDNRAQVLQQIPAESIESVEVITNPSAKYNPESTAGIINIVLKTNRKAGYYGSVSANANYADGTNFPGTGVGASLNYSNQKIESSFNIGVRNMYSLNTGWSRRYNSVAKDTLIQGITTKNSNLGLFLRGAVDYHIDKKNTFSLSGFGMQGIGNTDIKQNVLLNGSTPFVTKNNYTQSLMNVGNFRSYDLNLDYLHNFDKTDVFFTSGLAYSRHYRLYESDLLKHDWQSGLDYSKIGSNLEGYSDELSFKADYTNKFTESSKLEAGWQSISKLRKSKTSGFRNETPPVEMYDFYNQFDYFDQNHAAYFTYGDRFFDKLTLQGGLRTEYLIRDSSILTTKNAKGELLTKGVKSINYFKAYPSFYIAYTLPKGNELQLNYSTRINRPRGQQLNPYRNYTDSTRISYGNPELLPEYSSSFEFNYIKSWENHTLSSSAYYKATDDVIQGVRFYNNGVMESTSMNVSKSQSSGLEFILKDRLFTIVNLTSTLNLYYMKMDAATYVNPYADSIRTTIPQQENFSWTASEIVNVILGRTLSAQITGKYSAPQIMAQGIQGEQYSVDFGLRQTFFDKKINVSLTVSDVFNSRRTITDLEGTNFTEQSYSNPHGRTFGIKLSYNFGNMMPKKTDKMKRENGGEMNSEGERD